MKEGVFPKLLQLKPNVKKLAWPLETEITENHSKCDYNLYKGMKVNGFVETTVAGGAVVMNNCLVYPRKGKFIPREIGNT